MLFSGRNIPTDGAAGSIRPVSESFPESLPRSAQGPTAAAAYRYAIRPRSPGAHSPMRRIEG